MKRKRTRKPVRKRKSEVQKRLGRIELEILGLREDMTRLWADSRNESQRVTNLKQVISHFRPRGGDRESLVWELRQLLKEPEK